MGRKNDRRTKYMPTRLFLMFPGVVSYILVLGVDLRLCNI